MAIKLNRSGYEHARELITKSHVVFDERDDWSQHQPPAEKENDFIQEYGFEAYAQWHLGIDTAHDEKTKAHYKFPYGDFEEVHRCAVLAAEVRAGQYRYFEIEDAAAHLHGMIDALMPAHAKD